MKTRILSIIFLILLLSLTLSQAFGEIEDYLYLEDLRIEVDAPDEAKVNEEFNVKLSISPYEEIYVKTFIVTFGYSSSPIYEETLFYQQNITSDFSKTYVLKTKEFLYHRIPCKIKISYVTWKGSWLLERSYEKEIYLDLTYITDISREELEFAYFNYTMLKRDYESLKSYDEALSENYSNLYYEYKELNGELQEQKKMTGIFVLTTIIFLASTSYLEWKIRRIGKEQSKSTKKKGEGLIKEIKSLFFRVD